MNRELVGEGREHMVFKSRIDGWVLKTPKPATNIINTLAFAGASDVLSELAEARLGIKETESVIVPQTRVFRFGRSGYVIAQTYVVDDGSVSDIESTLKSLGQEFLAHRYVVGPSNFIPNNGSINLIDFTRTKKRILSRIGISPALLSSLEAKIKLKKNPR